MISDSFLYSGDDTAMMSELLHCVILQDSIVV